MDVGELTKMAASAIFAAISAVVGTLWFNSKPHLQVQSSEVVKFDGDKSKYGIATVTILSDGASESENIECSILLPGTVDLQCKPDILGAKSSIVGDTANVSLPLLNPTERLTITLLSSTPSMLPDRPQVSVRAKGIVGDTSPKTSYLPLALLIIACLLGSIVGSLFWYTYKSIAVVLDQSAELVRLASEQTVEHVKYVNAIGDELDRIQSKMRRDKTQQSTIAPSGESPVDN
jgi:hypothetical protein